MYESKVSVGAVVVLKITLVEYRIHSGEIIIRRLHSQGAYVM